MKLTYENPDKENWFLVSWTLSNKCNYSCDYCPTFLHNGSSGWPEKDDVVNFIKKFKLSGKEICYRITGGEPTYWKYFLEFAQTVKEQGNFFSFLTNGSQTVDYYKNIARYTDGMIISYHPKYANAEHIAKIANNIACPVALNLMLVPECFNEQLGVAKYLFDNTTSLAIWPKVLLDKTNLDYITNEVNDYSKSQKEIISDWPYFRKLNDSKLHRGNILLDGKIISANELIINNLNKHKGWSCWAGMHMLKIDMHGKIYRAECEQGGELGNIKSFTMPDSPITCEKEICACLSDIYLAKEKFVT